MTDRQTTPARPTEPLDVERLARAIPEDAVAPYSDWLRLTLARQIAAEYARLASPVVRTELSEPERQPPRPR